MVTNEDKDVWCRRGEEAEQRFAGPALPCGGAVFANPAKLHDKYTHDLFIVLPADLKTIRTQFRTASRYGIPPESAITVNKKDIDRYMSLYPHIVLVFDIDFPGFRSRRYAPLADIVKAIKRGHARLHTYNNRVDDERGNAKESYVLDALWFREL